MSRLREGPEGPGLDIFETTHNFKELLIPFATLSN